MSKRRSPQLGQALRGSTDLHAWSDSAAYLVRDRGKLVLTVEHRSAPAPDSFQVHLVCSDDLDAHLEIDVDNHGGQYSAPFVPLAEKVRLLLLDADAPMSRSAIRNAIKCNNQRLGDALTALESKAILERTKHGWVTRPNRDQLPLL